VGRGTKIGAALAVVALGAAGAVFVLRGDSRPDPEGTAEDYLAAWEEADHDAMARLVADPPASFAARHQAVIDDLGVTESTYELTGVSTDGDEAIATFDAQLGLAALGNWSYEGRVRLAYDDGWQVDWSPQTIHPQLAENEQLTRSLERPTRAPILDSDGEPLVTAVPGTVVGIQPSRVVDRQQVKDALSRTLGVDPALVDQRLDAPGVEPEHFVEITRISNTRYEQVRDAIYPVPGTVFRDTTVRTSPSEGFAQHLMGRTGDITAERLEELGAARPATRSVSPDWRPASRPSSPAPLRVRSASSPPTTRPQAKARATARARARKQATAKARARATSRSCWRASRAPSPSRSRRRSTARCSPPSKVPWPG
jgi:hypothetical protein